jgi:2-dehydropantoate 2-reductase
MKISVVGAGALGTFYSAMLAASGQDVTLLCRPGDREALEAGISITGAMQADEKPHISVSPVPSDLIFVTVKAYDVASAVGNLAFNPGTLVVIISNGLGSDEVAASIIGNCRVAAGVAYCGVAHLEPGKVKLAGYTETVLGSTDAAARDRLDLAVMALEQAGLKARIAEDIRAAQWEKLFANVGINATTAITGLNNGKLLEVPELKGLVAAAVSEAAEVARAAGIRICKDPVELTYEVIRNTADNRSSMLQDMARVKRTEIDVLNGKIGEIGRALGIPTPVNDTLTALVKGMERKCT